MVFPWILEQGGKYRDRVDKVKKDREDRLDAQRKRNRKKIKEGFAAFFDFVKDDVSAVIVEEFTVQSFLYTRGGIYGRSALLGFEAADVVATWAAEGTIEAGGAGAIDLFTPEIRRYEDTALVGLGGMII